MMTAEAIQKIIDLGQHDVDQIIPGAFFHTNANGARQIKFNTPEALEVFSLTQFVNAMPSMIVAQRLSDTQKALVNVINYDRVEVVVNEEDINGARKPFMYADFSDVFDRSSTGSYLSQESFIIDLLSKFEDTSARAELLKLVSSIKSGETKTSEDDGFSQTVEVKAGVTLVKEQTLKNLWGLKPFKTFPEIEQPWVSYILRVDGGKDNPRFALFEADGGRWKVQATAVVREWLIQALKVKLESMYDLIVVL